MCPFVSEGFVLVTAASGVRWTHRLPPLFRQLFESESSTYTYILADPHSEYHLPKDAGASLTTCGLCTRLT